MAEQKKVSCPVGVPTQLTPVAVNSARIEADREYWLCATLADTAPTTYEDQLRLLPDTIVTEDVAMSKLFGGLGTDVYLWAWPVGDPAFGDLDVSISYS